MKKFFISENIQTQFFVLFISLIFSLQIYLFNEIKYNHIKVTNLKNITTQIIEKQNNIKEKIDSIKILQQDIKKIKIDIFKDINFLKIEMAKIVQTNKYIISKIIEVSNRIHY